MYTQIFITSLGVATLLMSSCTVYTPDPIDMKAELRKWEQSSVLVTGPPLTQQDARMLGLCMNPALNKARLDRRAGRKVADQAGWWQDPSFSGEITRVIKERNINFSPGLSLAIPLTGIPSLEKRTAEAYAEADYWNLCRAEADYLAQVDSAWATLSIAHYRKTLISRRLADITQENKVIRRLVNAGEVDMATQQLAMQRNNDAILELRKAETDELSARMEMLKILGLHPNCTIAFSFEPTPSIPAPIPAPDENALIRSPQLRAAMATYAGKESELKTEIRKQYPVPEVGPVFSRDDGENEIGGSLSFNIPLWNRNRQAIAESSGNRDKARLATVQLLKDTISSAKQLAAEQQLTLQHCTAEYQRIESFASSLKTLEKLLAIGETTLPEVSENRHLVYESKLAWLESLEKLYKLRANLRYIKGTH